jgi:hypothetical protein
MGAAIGLAAIIVVMGVFLPAVLHAFENFLLTFFDIATDLLGDIKNL